MTRAYQGSVTYGVGGEPPLCVMVNGFWSHHERCQSHGDPGTYYGPHPEPRGHHVVGTVPAPVQTVPAEPCGALAGLAVIAAGITLAAGIGAAVAVLWARRLR
jgi:hypothetical protein